MIPERSVRRLVGHLDQDPWPAAFGRQGERPQLRVPAESESGIVQHHEIGVRRVPDDFLPSNVLLTVVLGAGVEPEEIGDPPGVRLILGSVTGPNGIGVMVRQVLRADSISRRGHLSDLPRKLPLQGRRGDEIGQERRPAPLPVGPGLSIAGAGSPLGRGEVPVNGDVSGYDANALLQARHGRGSGGGSSVPDWVAKSTTRDGKGLERASLRVIRHDRLRGGGRLLDPPRLLPGSVSRRALGPGTSCHRTKSVDASRRAGGPKHRQDDNSIQNGLIPL